MDSRRMLVAGRNRVRRAVAALPATARQRPRVAPRGCGSNGGACWDGLTDETLALPSHSRMPKQEVAPPAHRVRELTSKRSQNSKTYLLSNGQRQAVISAVPVNYRTPSGQWAPI